MQFFSSIFFKLLKQFDVQNCFSTLALNLLSQGMDSYIAVPFFSVCGIEGVNYFLICLNSALIFELFLTNTEPLSRQKQQPPLGGLWQVSVALFPMATFSSWCALNHVPKCFMLCNYLQESMKPSQ